MPPETGKRIQSHRDLIVWQKAIQLRRIVKRIILQLPRDEQVVLGFQLRKSSLSIPSNIAEGQGRFGRKEYRRFVIMARAEARELDTQLEEAADCQQVSRADLRLATALLDEVARMLTALARSLDQR